MTDVIEVQGLTKRYRDVVAVDDVSFTIEKDTIYGLLGRNGAGKTTVMSILTAQNFATSGEIRIFGEKPYENARVLSRMCFVREGQKYPDDAKPIHAFRSARLFFPHWDEAFAQRLIADFQLPVNRRIKKLSRGQLSAVGVIIAGTVITCGKAGSRRCARRLPASAGVAPTPSLAFLTAL